MKIPIKIKIFIVTIIITYFSHISHMFVLLWLMIPFLLHVLLTTYDDTKKESIDIKNYILIILSIVASLIYYLYNRQITTNYRAFIESIIVFLLYLMYIYDIPSKVCNMDYLYVKNIVIERVNKDLTNYIKLLKESGIYLILVTDKKYKYFKNSDKIILNQNITITKKLVKDIPKDKDILRIKSDKDLDKYIMRIKTSRGDYDNIVRANKLKIIFILSLLLSNIVLYILGFPLPFNIYSILFVYLLYSITIVFIIPYMKYDTDIMNRKPRLRDNKIFSLEEIIFIIVSSLAILIGSTLPYMNVYLNNGPEKLANVVYLISFIYCYFFTIVYYISEEIMLKNIIKNILHWTLIVIILLTIAFSLLTINKVILNTGKISLYNYSLLVLISLIAIIWQDIIKFGRTQTVRRKTK